MNERKILIVEDSPYIRASITYFLKEEGYRIDEASDGLEALAILSDRSLPQLIISDIQMPNMNGIEFLQIVKKKKSLAEIPIIIASIDTRVPDLCLKLGISNHTDKSIAAILSVTKRLLSS